MSDHPVAAETTAGNRRQSRLGIRVITMSTCPDQRSRFPRGRTESPTGTARSHWAEDRYAAVHPYSSTFLRPFAPDPLQALPHSYGRSDSCSRRFGSAGIIVRRPPLRLLREQVSLIHAPGLPTLLSPTICADCVLPGHVTPRQIAPRSLLHGTPPNENSGLRHCTAGSPSDTGRIEFLFVRTGRSPPAAHYPVSRRRNCLPLLVYVEPERTSTSLTECATSGAHCGSGSYRSQRRAASPIVSKSQGKCAYNKTADPWGAVAIIR